MERQSVLDLLMGAAEALEDVTDEELPAVVDAMEDLVNEGEVGR